MQLFTAGRQLLLSLLTKFGKVKGFENNRDVIITRKVLKEFEVVLQIMLHRNKEKGDD